MKGEKDVTREFVTEGTMLEKMYNGAMTGNDSSRKIVGTSSGRIDRSHMCCKE